MTAGVPAAPELGEQVRAATARWLETKKPATRTAYAAELRAYQDYLDRSGTLALGATSADAERYLAHRRQVGAADASIARSIAASTSWYEHMIAAGTAVSNPFEHIERPHLDPQDSATRVLTEPETQSLVYAAEHQPRRHGGRDTRPRDALALLLLLTLGMRASDMFALRIQHLTEHEGQRAIVMPVEQDTLMVRPIGAELERALHGHLVHRLGLVGQSAAEITLDELIARLAPQELLVTTDSGRALDRPALTHSLRRLAALAAIEHPEQVTPQTLRLTFAAATAEQGADRPTLQRDLGHADWRTTHRTLRRAARSKGRPAKNPPT